MYKVVAALGLTFLLAFLLVAGPKQQPKQFVKPPEPTGDIWTRMYPMPDMPGLPNPCAAYGWEGPEDEELQDVMVPIPMKDRVFNRTGIQCVWCSLECCGRYAEEPKLIGLTDQPDCKSYSSPSSANRKLTQIRVRFETTTSRSDRHLILKSVVQERRGCLFAIPGHAMTLVHYDEQKGVVKYINNSDRSLKIRTWTMQEFNRRWDGWITVIYADNDIIPYKYAPPATLLPILDRQGSLQWPKEYIVVPRR
jgi:hypothetical protein